MDELKDLEPKYKISDIASFDNEGSYMDAYVELLKQSIELLYRIVGLKYLDVKDNPKVLNKEDAVLDGNLTRLIKLNVSFLQNICDGKLEICYIINRCIAETAVNIKYFLVEGEDRVKRNYIKYSLITEKNLWETILMNVKERGGETLPIENRMQQSIQNSFDGSDFEINEIKNSSRWKSIKSRADAVADEMFYSVAYGISSHAVHGNWQDILYNNLEKVESGFKLNLKWNNPRPQIIDGTILFNLGIVTEFNAKELKNDKNHSLLKEKVDALFEYHDYLRESHKKWLTQ